MPLGGRDIKESTLWSAEQRMKEMDDHEISKILKYGEYEVITEILVDPCQRTETYSKEEPKISRFEARLKCPKCNFDAKSSRQFDYHLKTHYGRSSPFMVREPEVKPKMQSQESETESESEFETLELNLPGEAPCSDVLQDHSYSKPHQPVKLVLRRNNSSKNSWGISAVNGEAVSQQGPEQQGSRIPCSHEVLQDHSYSKVVKSRVEPAHEAPQKTPQEQAPPPDAAFRDVVPKVGRGAESNGEVAPREKMDRYHWFKAVTEEQDEFKFVMKVCPMMLDLYETDMYKLSEDSKESPKITC